jgi:hypothetical protein
MRLVRLVLFKGGVDDTGDLARVGGVEEEDDLHALAVQHGDGLAILRSNPHSGRT